MTTVVATRDMIVSDSMVSIPHKDLWYPAKKLIRGPGLIAGASGDGGDCSRFLEWAAAGFKGRVPQWKDKTSDDQVLALVVKADGIYAWSVGDPEPEKIEAECFACGTGGKAARIAMKYGADPIQAVKDAIEVDLWSGGEIQVLRLHDK
jgi:hypothetical protein